MRDVHLRHAKQQTSDLKPKIAAQNFDEDFIPFVCHYDPHTILTKNGELLQMIKITGFHHESIGSELVNLRETVREAITDSIKTNNFALWLHTIRRRKNIAPNGTYPDDFSRKLNDDWNKINNWSDQFVNELYLTVIIQGYDTSIINLNSLLRSLSTRATRNLHIKALDKSHKSLNDVVKRIVSDLDSYGAKLLGISEKNGVLTSEIMRVFGKIVNLNDEYFPLTVNDMSSDLAATKIAFGNQSLEVVGEDHKSFATMFSIKEYREVSITSLDKFMQLPQEFIITQSLDFIHRNKALPYFEYQNYILEISNDEEFRYLSDIEKTIDNDTKGETDYAQQQITIMLINSEIKGLEHDINTALEKLHNLGLVTIREDILSEHCFWSQLPGNFQYLRRQNPIISSRIGGFASLQNFPAGNRDGNYWGDAVSIFRTVFGTPYFFNFHNGDNGHTMITGPLGAGKTVLLSFLVCQSRKFKNRIYHFGYHRSGNIFINAMRGNYLSITDNGSDPQQLKLNPLLLPDSKENRQFLSIWFEALVNYGKTPTPPEEITLIPQIVNKIFEDKITKLEDAATLFNTEATKNIHAKLSIWYNTGKYAYIFDHEEENDVTENTINSFNLSQIVDYKALTIPTAVYLFYKIEQLLDGNPAMIVLDEAWRLLDNYITGPKINDWLIRMKKKNCVVIFSTESVKDISQSSITHKINHNIATQIFLPDPQPGEYYKTVFGLNDIEFDLLTAMSNKERHFLLKHDSDSVVAALDLSKISDQAKVLSSKPETLVIMEEVMMELGNDPNVWLPEFYKRARNLPLIAPTTPHTEKKI